MARFVTQNEANVGYSSDYDEEEEEFLYTPEVKLTAVEHELYIGNTGKIKQEQFYIMLRAYGYVVDLTTWRSHNRLYHARVLYKNPSSAEKVIELLNGKMYEGKRLRVSYVLEKTAINFPAAIRIDDICEDTTEEDIYDHFSPTGEIGFVIRTGTSAYIQFKTSATATLALGVEPILNGDPYTITRVFADDRIGHEKVLDSLKEIKYRKPFVIVENYPALEKGVPLSHYKQDFETVGKVLHFKIAPTENNTVTLGLCMEKSEERNMVIDKFNNSLKEKNVLKLYLAPGKARMTIDHAATFASCKNSVVVSAIPPYYKDYNVCKMFQRCGEINFLERFNEKWLICFESYTALTLAHYFQFMSYKQRLVVQNLSPQTIPAATTVVLQDIGGQEKQEPKLVPVTNASYWKKLSHAIEEQIKSKPLPVIPKPNPVAQPKPAAQPKPVVKQQPVVAKKQQQAPKKPIAEKQNKTDVSRHTALSEQAKLIAEMFKNKEELSEVKATPVTALEEPVTSKDVTLVSSSKPKDNKKSNNNKKEDDVQSMRQTVYMGNLPKGITELDLLELCTGNEITAIRLLCSYDSFHPTAAAYISFKNKSEFTQFLTHHHERFRDKRVMITIGADKAVFNIDSSIMVKNLTKEVSEESLLEEIENVIGPDTVVDILKPAHHYAYVDFKPKLNKNKIISALRRAFTPFKIDVFTLCRTMTKRMIMLGALILRPKKDVFNYLGLLDPIEAYFTNDNFGAHHAHELFIGNIPRSSLAEDLIDYLNNYGNVIDYRPIEKKSCYLRKSAIVSFENPQHALNVFRCFSHYFEGSVLELHSMETPPYMFKPEAEILTIKCQSPFLTTDEIRNTLNKYVHISYCLRFDAFEEQTNCVIRHKGYKKQHNFETLSAAVTKINEECVLIVDGLDLNPPLENEARENRHISDFRRKKEQYLSYVSYNETLKDDMEMRTQPNQENNILFRSFFNDSAVQINNVSLDVTPKDLCDLFFKCGNIIDYRAAILEEDQSKICYVKFDTDLAADLACTHNQKVLKNKRILIHLATDTLRTERERSVKLENLNPSITTEEIHDLFSRIGLIKYIQKQSPFTAIVCFKDTDSMQEALNFDNIRDLNNCVVRPCNEAYNPRFFDNFNMREEKILLDKLRTMLEPRRRPEYHQTELEKQVFDTFTVEEKVKLINEVFESRRTMPRSNTFTKGEQIIWLLKDENFTQKRNFLRLTFFEQEKLLSIDESWKNEFLKEMSKEMAPKPPVAKLARKESPAPVQVADRFATNWYTNPMPQQIVQVPVAVPVPVPVPVPMVMSDMQRNMQHVQQGMSSPGILSSLEPQRSNGYNYNMTNPTQLFGSNIPQQERMYGNGNRAMYLQNMQMATQSSDNLTSGHWVRQMAYNSMPSSRFSTYNRQDF